MEKKKITAKELKELIISSLESQKSEHVRKIEISGYEITDSFYKFASFKLKNMASLIEIVFHDCAFNGRFTFELGHGNMISVYFNLCYFQKNLTLNSYSPELRCTFKDVIVKEKLMTFGFVNKFDVSKVAASQIAVSIHERDTSHLELRLGKMYCSEFHANFRKKERANIKAERCHENSLQILNAILPGIVVKNIERDDELPTEFSQL